LAYHEYWLFWLAERIAGALTDKFIFVSKDIRDWFIDAKVSNPGKSAVSYVPWDLHPYMAVATISEEERQARRQTAGFSPETIVLGNVSRIVPWKGHEYGIRVLHELKKEFKNIKYMIVGGLRGETENAHQDALIELAKSLGVLQDVIFTGWQTDTPYFYSLFDIYLMTSMPLEGLGISAMEAYAAGVPVVGFDWFGAREILGENPNVVPSKDVAALAQAVKQEIVRLPETRLKRGEHLPRARKLQERHSLPRRLKEHAEIYRDLLENRERC